MRSGVTLAALLALLLGPVACGRRARPPRVTPTTAGAASAGPIRVRTDTGIRPLPLEEYVAGCVAAELGNPRLDADAGRRARAVQAILCRSFAVTSRGRHEAAGFDVCGTTHCQVYRPVKDGGAGRLAWDAARDTRGIILTFDGAPIRPVYHADCGGSTSAADEVWPGEAVAWLVPVEDRECARSTEWVFAADLRQLGRALAADSRVALRLPLKGVTVDRRDAAGRAALLRVEGANTVILRGDQFRAILLKAFGPDSLRSTLFHVRRSGSRLTFAGRGHGHGVGLCQAGSIRLAALGQAPEAILRHFYPGTRLGKVE